MIATDTQKRLSKALFYLRGTNSPPDTIKLPKRTKTSQRGASTGNKPEGAKVDINSIFLSFLFDN